jgi:hypothetical protein
MRKFLSPFLGKGFQEDFLFGPLSKLVTPIAPGTVSRMDNALCISTSSLMGTKETICNQLQKDKDKKEG